jgi:cytidylate kinase
MAIVTVDGYRGYGSTEVDTRIARALNATYIDRLLIRKAAERVQAPVLKLLGRAGREHRPKAHIDHLIRFLKRWLDFYSRHSMYINPWESFAFLGYYNDPQNLPGNPSDVPRRFVDNQRFIEAITSTLHEMARSDDLVVVGRGRCMLLRDFPNTLHVGLNASLNTRVTRNMRKHDLSPQDAAQFTRETDDARRRYFRKFFDTSPEDPSLYGLTLSTEAIRPKLATELVVSRASLLKGGRQN